MKIKIIKLGGSLITDENSGNKFNETNTRRLAEELYDFYPGTILVHGTGIVGKSPAVEYNYVESGTLAKEMKIVALEIKNRIYKLNQNFISSFISEGIPVQSIVQWQLRGSRFHVGKQRILELLQSGFVPVLFGDFALLRSGNFKVISSDIICHFIAKLLSPDKLIFLTDVDGVYDDSSPPTLIAKINRMNYPSLSIKNDPTDVSGGMHSKVKFAFKSSRYCKTCFIGNGTNRGLLKELLQGFKVKGTYVSSSEL